MFQAPAGRAPSILLSLLFVVAAGCGGARGPGGVWDLGRTAAHHADLYDIVPAHATYAFVADMTATDVALMRASGAANDPFSRAIGDQIEARTGVNLLSFDGIVGAGIDPEGDFAWFSPKLSPVGLVRLANPDAFRAFLDDVRDRNPDLAWSTFELAGAEFLSAEIEGVGVDVAVVGTYAALRIRLGDERLDADDVELSTFLLGDGGAGLRSDPRVSALSARADADAVASVAVVSTAPLWAAVRVAVEIEDGDFGYADDGQRDACFEAGHRALEALPWLGMVRQWDSDAVQRTFFVARLGELAAARARSLLPGTFTDTSVEARDAAVYFAGNVDLVGLADIMTGDPALADCPDLGGITGLAGAFAHEYGDQVRGTPLDGLVGLAIYGADFSGMLPRIDMALALGATRPLEVVEAIQDVLVSNGAMGGVDATAPYTELTYGLLGYRIRILQRDDRVVLAIGDAPVAMTSAMAASDARGEGSPFHEAHVNGARVATLVGALVDYVAEMGVLPEGDLAALETTVSTYETIREITVDGRMDGADMVFEVEAAYDVHED